MPSQANADRPDAQPIPWQAWIPSRAQRFGLWVGGVLLTLGSPLLGLVVTAPLVADTVALAGLGLLLVLLATTPADAIKLPRWASWLVIALGAAWMIGMRLAPPGRGDFGGTLADGFARALMLGSIFTAIVLLAIGIVWCVRKISDMRRPPPRHEAAPAAPAAPSPWRVVLYAWHPALPLVAVGTIGPISEPRSVVSVAIAGGAIFLVALAADAAVNHTPRLSRSLAYFAVSAAMVVIARLL